ncbi:MAG: hypothetical protein A2505_10400 [Deltaproteobacteria bacterium RIFOXYD12_FULL_55_16]|nr:MAG: hypothetical protein A2505_10400 [Deltaproteobacteria bacterium RIFOXYD12_FULL_55_16]
MLNRVANGLASDCRDKAGIFVTVVLLAIAGCLEATVAFSAEPVVNVNPQPAPDGGANAITQAAVQKGVLNCASRINQVTNFLNYGPQAGAFLMLPPNPPDQRLVPLAMEVPTESGSAYVSVTFAPNQANGCGAAYDAVMYWPQKCEVVASKQFSTLKKTGPLRKDILTVVSPPKCF